VAIRRESCETEGFKAGDVASLGILREEADPFDAGKEAGVNLDVLFPMVVAFFVDINRVLAGAKHLAEIGVAELDALVDLDGGAGWVRAELEQAGLFELARFIKRKTHRNEHEYKNYRNDRNAHKDIS